jgi:hypothetical protein
METTVLAGFTMLHKYPYCLKIMYNGKAFAKRGTWKLYRLLLRTITDPVFFVIVVYLPPPKSFFTVK